MASMILSALANFQQLIVWLIPLALIFGLLIAKVKWKKWVVDVVIIERRGKNLIKTNDRAARYYDKFSGLTGYKLLKAKDTIPVVEYGWILHNANKNTNLLEKIINLLRPTAGTLFLFRYGSKQYKPIKMGYNEKVKKSLTLIKDKKGNPIYVERYQQLDPRGYLEAVSFEIVDWDNMNFMVQEMRASFERRQKQNAWLKQVLVPLALIAVAAMVSIVMMKFSLDYSQSLGPDNTQPVGNTTTDTPGKVPFIGDVFTPGE